MPISSPLVFTSAPPEFPLLIAASVCIKDSTPFVFTYRERLLALTIPAVTVFVRLKGLPTARTHSPTFISSLFAIVIAGKPLPSIFIRAKSVLLSVPMIRAEYSLLSLRVTVSSSAPSTTWTFRGTYLTLLRTSPLRISKETERIGEEITERITFHFHCLDFAVARI